MNRLIRAGFLALFAAIWLSASTAAFAQAETQTVVENANGTATITLPDGTEVTLPSNVVAAVVAALENPNATVDSVQTAIQGAVVLAGGAASANIATAVAVLASVRTTNPAFRTAAVNGVRAANPSVRNVTVVVRAPRTTIARVVITTVEISAQLSGT